MDDYYGILGVRPNAKDAELKGAFRQLAKRYHPDSEYARENPSEANDRFLKINEAYHVLSDREKRLEYDRHCRSEEDLSGKEKSASARSFYREGRRAYKSDLFEKASEHFRKAAVLEPENPLYCSWLGLSLSKRKGSLHEAKQWCERATALSPSNADFYVNLALVYRNAEIRTLSLKYLRKATAIDPSHRRALYWIEKIDEKKEGNLVEKIKGLFRSRKRA